MQPDALQTLRSSIQATILPNWLADNHLSTVWEIGSGATSYICAHRSMFEGHTKVEQTSDI